MTDDHDIDNIDALDVLIEDVAKAMTAGPAGDDFARRVSMRIAEAGDRRQSWFRPWVLVPLAAAIVLIVLVRLTPETTRDAKVAQKPDTTVRLKPDATPDNAIRLKADTTQQARAETSHPQPIAPLPRIVSIADAPAPAVEPIEIHALDVQPLVEMDEIAIGAIAIDRIEIAAMP